jgi:hypothetical protein
MDSKPLSESTIPALCADDLLRSIAELGEGGDLVVLVKIASGWDYQVAITAVMWLSRRISSELGSPLVVRELDDKYENTTDPGGVVLFCWEVTPSTLWSALGHCHVAMHLSRDGLMILKSRLVLTYTTDRFPITHLIREDRINEVTTLIDQNLPPDLH